MSVNAPTVTSPPASMGPWIRYIEQTLTQLDSKVNPPTNGTTVPQVVANGLANFVLFPFSSANMPRAGIATTILNTPDPVPAYIAFNDFGLSGSDSSNTTIYHGGPTQPGIPYGGTASIYPILPSEVKISGPRSSVSQIGYIPPNIAIGMGAVSVSDGLGTITPDGSGQSFGYIALNADKITTSGTSSLFVNGPATLNSLVLGSVSTTSSAANTYYDSVAGTFSRVVSLGLSKKNVVNLDPELVMDLRPITFQAADGSDIETHVGLIAEEVDAAGKGHHHPLAAYNSDGVLESVEYDRVGIAVLAKVQQLDARVKVLETEVSTLQTQVAQLIQKVGLP